MRERESARKRERERARTGRKYYRRLVSVAGELKHNNYLIKGMFCFALLLPVL